MQQQQMQNMNQNQTGQIMTQPPNMISSKDLLYLTDMMSWNLGALKKAHCFSQKCTIPEIQTALDNVSKMHEKHYQTLLQYTKQHSNSQVH
ncbi:hypothetical protein J2T56_002435 [Natronobacillus azotifigens]|uniref:Spore coat protein n=1 Tax=Natronobacillus azotifigens TaxID=472978 RepID=A0A9J6RDJ9_9BACI|nr:spore coat protein [Natronobacillus azotifigens]MCZ0703273.1 spore coat protein [Natronobacillus azotifigens]